MPRRVVVLLVAVAVGVLFAAGLFIRGPFGGVLLLATDAVLIGLARLYWRSDRPRAWPARLAIILVVAVIAVAKLVS